MTPSDPLRSNGLAAVRAVALALMLLGCQAAAGPGANTAPTAAPTPVPTIAPTPVPTAAPTPKTTTWRLGEDPRYPFFVSAAIDILTPADGWSVVYDGPTLAVVWSVDGGSALLITNDVTPYADPCASGHLERLTIDPRVDWWKYLGWGVTNSPAAFGTFDGYPDVLTVLTAPEPRPGCEDGVFHAWGTPTLDLSQDGATRVHVVDVDGTRVVIVLEDRGSTRETMTQMRSMFNSIELAPISD